MSIKLPAPIDPGTYGEISVFSAWNPLVKIIESLDCFCTKSDEIFGFGIRIVSKNLSPDRTCNYNHAGLFPIKHCSNTYEALWKLDSQNFFSYYEKKEVLIARWNKMTPLKAQVALDGTMKHIGQTYPILRIPLHLFNLAHLFHWKSLVCSEYVAKNLYLAGARGSHYYGTTPDHLADEFHNSLNKERTGPKYNILFEGTLPFLLYRYCSDFKAYILMPHNYKKCYLCGHDHYVVGEVTINQETEIGIHAKILNYNMKKHEIIRDYIST